MAIVLGLNYGPFFLKGGGLRKLNRPYSFPNKKGPYKQAHLIQHPQPFCQSILKIPTPFLFIYSENLHGSNALVLIEWKYTEEYRQENKYIPDRYNTYNKLLEDNNCPIVTNDYESLYNEPFYQLMRQTLLGWKMVQAGEYQCDEYMHVHVIPENNTELRDRVTSPGLNGRNISEAWKSVLKDPEQYIVISPEEFIKPSSVCPDTQSIITYLEKRYWNEIYC